MLYDPSAGITQIRFNGCNLRLLAGTTPYTCHSTDECCNRQAFLQRFLCILHSFLSPWRHQPEAGYLMRGIDE